MTTRHRRSVQGYFIIGGVIILSLLFTVGVLAALPPDNIIADFQTGAAGNCYIAPSTWDGNVDGEVILSPTVGEAFGGTDVPGGWYSGTYVTSYPVVGNSFITVETAYAGVTATAAYVAPQSLGFEANFTDRSQWVGLASDSNLGAIPWALFGTFGSSTDLFADTRSGTNVFTTQVITGGLGTPHRFQIDWTPGVVTYYIDGVVVATHSIDVGIQLHPIMADNFSDNLPLSVDWLHLGSYSPATCVYTSHLFDSGIPTPNWITLTTSTYVPANTVLNFETRSGNTTNPDDGSWSAWSLVSNGGIASGTNGQYLQYRAALTTTDSLSSPRVYSVQPAGETPTAVMVTNIVGQATNTEPSASRILLIVSLGALGLIAFGYGAIKARKTNERN